MIIDDDGNDHVCLFVVSEQSSGAGDAGRPPPPLPPPRFPAPGNVWQWEPAARTPAHIVAPIKAAANFLFHGLRRPAGRVPITTQQMF